MTVDELDQEQQKAVMSEGQVAVVAGPGSGKTRTLIAKAQHESQNGAKVVAVTFTRNAAQELKSRLTNSQAHHVTASTIHSFCLRNLHKFPGEYESLLDEFLLLYKKPKYDVILVDEFQDLTAKELKVILSLYRPNSRLFFVGDNSQAIFGYCDAEGREIPKTQIKKIYLTKNYRNSKTVIDKLERINLRGLTPIYPDGNPNVKGTAILFRENSQLDAVAVSLMNLGYSFCVRKRGMKYPGEVIGNKKNPEDLIFSTIHCSKGMEWEKVICWDWGMRYLEKNLYYVAIARASREFHLVNSISECVKCLG